MLIIAALMAYSVFFFFYSLGASVAKIFIVQSLVKKYKVPKKKKKIFASQSPYINSSQDTVTMYSRSFYFWMT